MFTSQDRRAVAEGRRRAGTGWITVLGFLGLACWVVMFLAGTDVWHFAGSPDIWTLDGAPYADVRAFAYAFYGQLFVLVAVIVAGLLARRKFGHGRTAP